MMHIVLDGIILSWDENKNMINIAKHGIDFNTAALVFADTSRIEYYDVFHSVDEDRYITIGVVEKVLFVVYTQRGPVTRLISARVATKEERQAYYGNSI